MLNKIKSIFSSKRSKLLKQISEKFDISEERIQDNMNQYRIKHNFYPHTHSDNKILELILSEDEYFYKRKVK